MKKTSIFFVVLLLIITAFPISALAYCCEVYSSSLLSKTVLPIAIPMGILITAFVIIGYYLNKNKK